MKKGGEWRRLDVSLLTVVSFLIGFLFCMVCTLFYLLFYSPEESPLRITFDQWSKSDSNSSEQVIKKQKEPGSPEYLDQSLSEEEKVKYRLWETTTVIRNGLYQYIKHNEQMPKDLSELTEASPGNYLSSIPKNPINYSNNVARSRSRTGGWVYLPQTLDIESTSEIEEVVQQSLIPNLKTTEIIPFEPLKLFISKSENRLYLASGDQVITKFPVALGMNDRTPVGTFYIQKRVVNPNESYYESGENPYGTRSLELSNPSYAIHGTNQPEKVGLNVSSGCIRLKTENIESIYPKVSLYTPVEISESPLKEESYKLPISDGLTKDLYDQTDQPREEYPSTFYKWLN